MPQLKQGLRFNSGKVRFDLVPHEAEEALAEHYGRGAMKYPGRNWENGMPWMGVAASLRRHLNKWLAGEDYDEETGGHHMIAVAWNAIALFTYFVRGLGTDDRVRVRRKNVLYLPVPKALQGMGKKPVGRPVRRAA